RGSRGVLRSAVGVAGAGNIQADPAPCRGRGMGVRTGSRPTSADGGRRAPPDTLLRYGLRVPNVTRPVEMQASRTLLGAGSRHQIGDLIAGRKAFVISSGSARSAAEETDASAQVVGRFGRPVVHTPVVVTEDALEVLRSVGAEV